MQEKVTMDEHILYLVYCVLGHVCIIEPRCGRIDLCSVKHQDWELTFSKAK
jgi:hypothetical protein